MRIYIHGKLSNPQETFILSDLFFSTEDCEYPDIPGRDCVCLSGHYYEGILSKDRKEFSTRIKGVDIEYTNENGEDIDTENFSVAEFKEMVENRKLTLRNAMAHYSSDVIAQITSIKLGHNEIEWNIPVDIVEEIEFIA